MHHSPGQIVLIFTGAALVSIVLICFVNAEAEKRRVVREPEIVNGNVFSVLGDHVRRMVKRCAKEVDVQASNATMSDDEDDDDDDDDDDDELYEMPPPRSANRSPTSRRLLSEHVIRHGHHRRPDAANASRPAQGAPRALPDATDTAQSAPRALQDATDTAQGAPRALQDFPALQGDPRALQDAPALQGAPALQDVPRTLQGAPRALQDAPDDAPVLQEAPRALLQVDPCYSSRQVLWIIALTCALNFCFVLVVMTCVRLLGKAPVSEDASWLHSEEREANLARSTSLDSLLII